MFYCTRFNPRGGMYNGAAQNLQIMQKPAHFLCFFHYVFERRDASRTDQPKRENKNGKNER